MSQEQGTGATIAVAAGREKRRVYERVASNLVDAIKRGEYVDGSRLPSERDLMQSFGVSRASVREALLALQGQGFISISGGARARITKPGAEAMLAQLSGAARTLFKGPEGIAHFQEARSLFECAIARQAARHATPKQIVLLSAALRANQRAARSPEEFVRTDMAFHLAIAQMPNNPIFIALHAALGDWLVEQRSTGLRVRGSIRSVCRDHERIFEAIQRHDVDGAEAAMATHLTSVARYFWRARAELDGPV